MSRPRTPRVRFAYSTDFTRPLRDDELFVIEAFKTHTNHCLRCVSIPCSRAHAYARDMANYVYLDAGRPYSVIDQRADFGHIKLDMEPPLLEAVQRGLRIVQGAPKPKTRIYPEAQKRLSPRTYEIVEVISENSHCAEKPKRTMRERTSGGNSKVQHRQTEHSYDEVLKSNHCRSKRSGGKGDIIWVEIALKRSELMRLIY
jgi:hypothetical protein